MSVNFPSDGDALNKIGKYCDAEDCLVRNEEDRSNAHDGVCRILGDKAAVGGCKIRHSGVVSVAAKGPGELVGPLGVRGNHA